jgi:hypothetical protein
VSHPKKSPNNKQRLQPKQVQDKKEGTGVVMLVVSHQRIRHKNEMVTKTKNNSAQKGGHMGSSEQKETMEITKKQTKTTDDTSVCSVASKDKSKEQAMNTTKASSGQEGGHRGSSVSSVQIESNDNHSIEIMQELGATKRKLSDSIKSYRRRIENPTPHGQIISEVTTSIINDEQVESE